MIGAVLNSIYQFFCGGGSAQQQPQQPQPPPQKPEVVYTPYHPPVHLPQPHRPPVSEYRPAEPYQYDAINQNNETYKRLRAQANEEGDKMAQCFQQGHDAYARGDGAQAKEFSNEGKEHQRKMDSLNKQASDWIFKANNLVNVRVQALQHSNFWTQDNQPGEIDLHDLYVKEAISRAEDALKDAKRKGETEVKFIVGKGLHSTSGAKIRPAIEDLIKKYRLDAEIDPQNAGVIVVQLQRRPALARWG